MQPPVPLGVIDLRDAFVTTSFFAPAAVAEEDRLLTAAQVAEIFSTTPWWVYNVFSREVPPVKVGRLSRWEPWRIKRYIDEHRAEVVR